MSSSHQIPATMKGVYLPGNCQCDVRDVPVPKPGPGQCLVQMRASAICGSDLRAIYRPKVHRTGPEGYTGCIAGHEPCGIVVQRGPGVPEDWKEGTRVVVYHVQGCGECHYCRQGLYIYCTNDQIRKAYGWQRDGGHGEYLLADTQSLVRLPEPLTYIDGAMVACGLGTGYAACVRGNISGRDKVLVTGLGPVGLGVALLAQCMGARVVGLEKDASRVAFAKKLGITAFECAAGGMDDDVKKVVEWAANGEGVDVAIDCSGNANARLTCMLASRVWGRVVFVGEEGRVEFDVSEVVIHKNLAIYGSWVCSVAQMEELVDLMVVWNLHPEITVTHTFTIDEAPKAYEIFNTGKTGKCTILYAGEEQKYKAEQ